MTWKNLYYSHGWAFFYFLKKNGENPEVSINSDGTLNVEIRALI